MATGQAPQLTSFTLAHEFRTRLPALLCASAAPPGSGLDGKVCHRCRVYWDTYGRLPAGPR